jgi:hypothetical protein
LYGAFVWARRALKHQKRRFPARAVDAEYIATNATYNSDRVCAALTDCGAGGEPLVPRTDYADRECICRHEYWYVSHATFVVEPAAGSGSWDASASASGSGSASASYDGGGDGDGDGSWDPSGWLSGPITDAIRVAPPDEWWAAGRKR